jgi:hypothetical protein
MAKRFSTSTKHVTYTKRTEGPMLVARSVGMIVEQANGWQEMTCFEKLNSRRQNGGAVKFVRNDASWVQNGSKG